MNTEADTSPNSNTGPSSVDIRHATTDDLEEVIGLMQVVYADTYPNDRGITREMFVDNEKFQGELRRHFGEQLRNPGVTFWLAKSEGRVIGTIGLKANPDDSSSSDVWGFYVNPELQHQGIGSRLWDTLMQSEQVAPLKTLRLTVAKDSQIAKALYEKKGFVVTGEEDWDWPHWTEEHPHNQYWLMEKRL